MLRRSEKQYIKDESNIIFNDNIFESIHTTKAFLSPDEVYLLLLDRDIASVIGYLSLLSRRCTFIITDSDRPCLIDQLCETHSLRYIISSKRINNDSITSEEVINLDHCQNLYLYRTHVPAYSKEQCSFLSQVPSILITTSGSTSTSKLVRLSYQNLEANTSAIAESLTVNKSDCGISVLPLSYTYGLSVLNMHLYKGASFVLNSSSVMEETFWMILAKEPITNLAGVPFSYDLYQRIGLDKCIPPSLRFITQAGGKLELESQKKVLEYCQRTNISFYIMYGQTEATARISCFELNQHPEKLGSVGKSLPNLTVNTSDAAISSELEVHGPSISTGYAASFSDLLKPHIRRSLKTGDLAEIDDEGFIFIRGRISRFAKISGIRICLETVEADILHTLGLQVYAVSDDQFIYIASLIKLNARYVKKVVKVHPSKIKLVMIPKIPRTPSGKINYAKILENCIN